jgi:hypothetical protein
MFVLFYTVPWKRGTLAVNFCTGGTTNAQIHLPGRAFYSAGNFFH